MSESGGKEAGSGVRRRMLRVGVQVVGFLAGLGSLAWCVSLALRPENQTQFKNLVHAPPQLILGMLGLSLATVILNGVLFWIAIITGGLTLFQRSGGGQSTITRTRIEGDLLGNVDVSYGSVLNLDVGRKIGASAALPITMTVRDNIFRLVGGEIHANITANGSTDNLVQHIKATGANGTSGDFTGSLSTKRLTCGDCGAGAARGFEVLRNLDADLTFSHGVFDPIKMYYSLNGDITIGTVGQPATYVSNQVIINASGLDAGTWSGDVSVASGSGFITVAPKLNYTNLPSTIGGGAVGYAGFTFHAQACSPQHEAALATPPASAVIDHYGPVINTTGDPALMIEHRPIGTTGAWTDQTGDFSIVVESTGTRRHITATPTAGHQFLPGKEYRIQPAVENQQTGQPRLKCLFDSNTVGVTYYVYRFSILSPFDMNEDTYINISDAAVWPSAPRDFNNDQAADVMDYSLLLQQIANQP